MGKRVGLIVVALVVGLVSSQVLALDGSGTEGDPYLIEDFADFNEFASNSGYWASGIHTQLTTDLDLDPNLPGRQIYTTAVIAPYTLDADFQFNGIPFEGVFQGGGHLIKNITIDTEEADNEYLGLFGQISGEQVRVKNLGLENVSIIGGNNSRYLGGLSGQNYGTISNCYANISISGQDRVGGLCGFNEGTINNCYVTGSISGGGADPWRLGGLCGENGGTISNCYATTSVTGGSYSDYLGGLCGFNNGTINNCYSTGTVAGEESQYFGGLCGENNGGSITNCFWDIETSGQTWSDGGTGLPTEDMQMQITFSDAHWDFINNWNIGENQTYPYLRTVSASDINKDHITNFIDLCIVAEEWMNEE